jgi:predicted N-acetyltransferase YhbS
MPVSSLVRRSLAPVILGAMALIAAPLAVVQPAAAQVVDRPGLSGEDFSALAKKLMPSVVNISTRQTVAKGDGLPKFAEAVERLYDEVFGPGRFAKTAERLREGNVKIAPACFVAQDALGYVGAVRLWPVTVGASSSQIGARAAFLGPLAVAARRRGNGVAFRLMERAIGVCRELGYSAVILVGDEAYYDRWMFRKAGVGRFTLPGPVDQTRILIRDLSPAAAELKGLLSVPRDATPAS